MDYHIVPQKVFDFLEKSSKFQVEWISGVKCLRHIENSDEEVVIEEPIIAHPMFKRMTPYDELFFSDNLMDEASILTSDNIARIRKEWIEEGIIKEYKTPFGIISVLKHKKE